MIDLIKEQKELFKNQIIDYLEINEGDIGSYSFMNTADLFLFLIVK